MKSYLEIKHFYGDKKAESSGLLLMNHIDEGLVMLNDMSASSLTMDAWCLHPMIQCDKDFVGNFRILYTFPKEVVISVLEYRRAANAYLCKPYTDNWGQHEIGEAVGCLIPSVKQMLIVDKIQNQKDFIDHHYGTHPRSNCLLTYFNNWLVYLERI